MFTCASCSSQHSEGPVCSTCKLHYDFQCSGVAESSYRRWGDTRKNSWCCPKCKSSPLPSPAVASPMPIQLDKIQEQLNKVMLQLAPLASLAEDVKTIKAEISNLKDSIEMAHQLINDFSGKVKVLESRVSGVEGLTAAIPALRNEIAVLQQEMNDKDQWARANNVEVRGIPVKKHENLYEIANKISQICNFPIKKEDINYIARIPTRVADNIKPILIAFNNRYIKEELIASSRKCSTLTLRNLGCPGDGSIYITDHLTQRNKTLLRKAKALAKDKNFKYVWVKHCKIMARKSDSSPVFFIRGESDLSKIV